MPPAPSTVEREIAEQPAVLERIIRRPWPEIAGRVFAGARGVLTVARGSSDNAATYFSYLVQAHMGLPVAPVPPSVTTLYRRRPLEVRGHVAIGVSQSGKSPDVVHALESLREGGARTVAVTNDPDSPLARTSDEVVALECGPERAVPATKTFTGSLAALVALVAGFTKNATLRSQLERVPEACSRSLEVDVGSAAELWKGAEGGFVLGRSFGLGIACEGALKIKEIVRIHSEAASTAEFLHGPLVILRKGTPVVVLVPPRWDAVESKVAIVPEPLERGGPRVLGLEAAWQLSLRGASVILLGASAGWARCVGATVGLSPNHGLPAELAPIVQAIVLQRLAVAAARARGLDPDAPAGVTKVTETW